MKIQRLMTAFIIITAVGLLYDKYKEKYDPEPEKVQFQLIQKYLLNEPGFDGSDKPLMWVFSDHKFNARHWKSFNSRKSRDLNQPYIHMCIELIVKHCGNSFNICLINSESFDKLLNDWTINVNELSEPIRSRVIQLGLFRILHKYGGVCMPNTMIMFEDFKHHHDNYLGATGCYFGEFVCRSVTSELKQTFPNNRLFGCEKNNENMKELCNYLEKIISTDNSAETDFIGNLERYVHLLIDRGAINKLPGQLIGTKKFNGDIVLIDELLENSEIHFNSNIACLYIPGDEVLKRRKYGWFARLNKIQVLSSNTNVGKMFAMAYNN